jgi:hypothetical protein
MSASYDKTQKATFVFTNLYQIYRKGKDAAVSAQLGTPAAEAAPFIARSSSTPSASRNVLKADDLRQSSTAQPRVEAYNPPAFIGGNPVKSPIGKRLDRPEYLAPQRNEAIESLKENLKTLNDLHSRLRFMLQELEELVK